MQYNILQAYIFDAITYNKMIKTYRVLRDSVTKGIDYQSLNLKRDE